MHHTASAGVLSFTRTKSFHSTAQKGQLTLYPIVHSAVIHGDPARSLDISLLRGTEGVRLTPRCYKISLGSALSPTSASQPKPQNCTFSLVPVRYPEIPHPHWKLTNPLPLLVSALAHQTTVPGLHDKGKTGKGKKKKKDRLGREVDRLLENTAKKKHGNKRYG